MKDDLIRQTAHQFWEEAGKPEGLSDYFWYQAEDYCKRPRVIYENLKLPVCPKCNDTKHVVEMNVAVLLVARESYPWYKCNVCGIKWNARDGIREKEDARPCFG